MSLSAHSPTSGSTPTGTGSAQGGSGLTQGGSGLLGGTQYPPSPSPTSKPGQTPGYGPSIGSGSGLPTSSGSSAGGGSTGSVPSSLATPPQPPVGQAAGQSDDFLELGLLYSINIQRQQVGCPSVTHNSVLAETAEKHSREMAEHGYVASRGLDGRSPGQRIRDAGYRFTKVREMVTGGQDLYSEAFGALMNSFEYRQRIKNCDWREIGVGVWRLPGSTHGTYWTVDLGIPR
ncbi:MAG: CAP domain-containing protein [Angustibacter sp.]